MEVLRDTIKKMEKPVIDDQRERVIKTYEKASAAFWFIMNENIKGKIILNEYDKYVIKNMILWLMKDDSCAWNLSKGILLCGSYGVGKSTLMKCAKSYAYHFAEKDRQFGFVRVNNIVRQVAGNGSISEINQYTTGNFCLDDIGQLIEEVTIFGSKYHILKTLICERVGKTITTHGTTNVKPSFFENQYDKMVASRMHEMFNIVEMEGTTDHRK